jgi:hypothetical protein
LYTCTKYDRTASASSACVLTRRVATLVGVSRQTQRQAPFTDALAGSQVTVVAEHGTSTAYDFVDEHTVAVPGHEPSALGAARQAAGSLIARNGPSRP